ncbi:unnamed protein product [Paramecium sonneborni]|uniref:Transmembrane protein n=1 Tax=Paramecium sonneborni TaxID=65129 RepID=A0A8S1R9M8_9CILI|nr:unnamed protein product [Paramecium sonneborni]
MNSGPEKIMKRRQTRFSFTNTLPKTSLPKKISAPASEITAEFFKRQKEYDNFNKYSFQEQNNDEMKFSMRKSNFHSIKDAVKQAKLKFFESTPQWNNFMNKTIPSYQQQYNSIKQIANQFRNQRKMVCVTHNQKPQSQKQWNLSVILIIVVPIICIIRVLFALIFTL